MRVGGGDGVFVVGVRVDWWCGFGWGVEMG